MTNKPINSSNIGLLYATSLLAEDNTIFRRNPELRSLWTTPIESFTRDQINKLERLLIRIQAAKLSALLPEGSIESSAVRGSTLKFSFTPSIASILKVIEGSGGNSLNHIFTSVAPIIGEDLCDVSHYIPINLSSSIRLVDNTISVAFPTVPLYANKKEELASALLLFYLVSVAVEKLLKFLAKATEKFNSAEQLLLVVNLLTNIPYTVSEDGVYTFQVGQAAPLRNDTNNQLLHHVWTNTLLPILPFDLTSIAPGELISITDPMPFIKVSYEAPVAETPTAVAADVVAARTMDNILTYLHSYPARPLIVTGDWVEDPTYPGVFISCSNGNRVSALEGTLPPSLAFLWNYHFA